MSLVQDIDESLVFTLLEGQLRKAKALARDFQRFDCAPAGSPEKTSTFLYNAARQAIVRNRRLIVRDSLCSTNVVPGAASLGGGAILQGQKAGTGARRFGHKWCQKGVLALCQT